MSMINIDELNRINEDRDKRRLETYDKVLKKCHERIKLSHIQKRRNFLFLCSSCPRIWYSHI